MPGAILRVLQIQMICLACNLLGLWGSLSLYASVPKVDSWALGQQQGWGKRLAGVG